MKHLNIFEKFGNMKDWETLTGREIEIIYNDLFCMKIYQTDAALGYKQLAFLIQLDKSINGYNYLCIDTHNITYGDTYRPGKIVEDLEDIYVEESDYDISNSPLINEYLFKHFLKTYYI